MRLREKIELPFFTITSIVSTTLWPVWKFKKGERVEWKERE